MKNAKLKLIIVVSLVLATALTFALGGCSWFDIIFERDDCDGHICPDCETCPEKVTFYPEDFNKDSIGLEIHYIDVGQGHAALIKFDDGKTMLIDAGSGSAANPNAQIRQYFNTQLQNNIDGNYIDYLVITHAHSDHINLLTGTNGVLNTYTVGTIYKNKGEHDTQTAQNMRARIAQKEATLGTEVFRVDGETTYNITGENYSVDIYSPGVDAFGAGNLNNNSMFIAIEYNERNILFTGDAEEAGEAWFIETYSKAKDNTSFCLLKVGHHGANTSTTQPFLNYFTIEYAVIAVAESNTYSHPHPMMMNRLFVEGAVTYRTNRHGTVTALIDTEGNMAFRVTAQAPVENNRLGKPDLMIIYN
jgi:competence protein ComEC